MLLPIEVNDLATGAAVYHTRERNLSRLHGRIGSWGCAGQEFNVKNTVSERFSAREAASQILYIFICKPGRVVGNADVNEMEIPSGVLKYLWKIMIRQRNARESLSCNGENLSKFHIVIEIIINKVENKIIFLN